MNQEIRRELLKMSGVDADTRQRLIETGELFEGYATEMEAVHRSNAVRLEQIIARHGWPGLSMVGEDGCEAAWLIAQHSISLPELQTAFLRSLQDAVSSNEAPQRHEAYLLDRILFNRDRPQLYGLVFDWNGEGELSAWIDQDDLVDARRKDLGLPSFEEATRQARLDAERNGRRAPSDLEGYREKRKRWAREVGWLDEG